MWYNKLIPKVSEAMFHIALDYGWAIYEAKGHAYLLIKTLRCIKGSKITALWKKLKFVISFSVI